MQMFVTSKGRSLKATIQELKCYNCAKKESEEWYFYSLDKKLYCRRCACRADIKVDSFEQLIRIDKIEFENGVIIEKGFEKEEIEGLCDTCGAVIKDDYCRVCNPERVE